MKSLKVKVNGQEIAVEAQQTVAGALLKNNILWFRTSLQGQKRAPLCGMGICHECRVEINGKGHQRSCMILCKEGMEIKCE